MDDLNDIVKHALDWVSLSTVVGTLIGVLPAIAALFAIVWTAMRIFTGWPAVVKRWKEVFR